MEKEASKFVLAASSGKIIYIVETGSLAHLVKFDAGLENITSLSWNSDNSLLCSSGNGKHITCSHSKNPSNLIKFAKNIEQQLVYFSRKKADTLVTGGNKGVSLLWATNGSDFTPMRGFSHESNLCATSISLNQTDSIMALGCHPNNTSKPAIVFYNVEESNRLPCLTVPLSNSEVPTNLLFSPSNKNYIGCSTSLGSTFFYDVTTGNNLINFKNEDRSESLGFNFMSPNSPNLIHAFSNGRIVFYDLLHRRSTNVISVGNKLSSFTLSENYIHFFVGTLDGKLYQYDVRNYAHPFDLLAFENQPITNIAIQAGLSIYPNVTMASSAQIVDAPDSRPPGRVSVAPLKKKTKDVVFEDPSLTLEKKTKNKASIFSLFNSPASRLSKKHIDPPLDISAVQKEITPKPIPNEPMNDSKATENNSTIKSFKNSNSSITSSTFSANTLENDTMSEPRSFKTSMPLIGEQINNDPQALDNSFKDLHESIHVHIRDLHFDLVRQLHSQTNEFKNFITDILLTSNKREQELLNENMKLRKEVTLLKKYIEKNINQNKNNGLNGV